MIWFCALLGVIAGLAFDSFPLGMLFVFLGCVFGWMIRRDRKKIETVLTELKQKIDLLEHKNSSFSNLIAQLEQRLTQATFSNTAASEVQTEPASSGIDSKTSRDELPATDLLMSTDTTAASLAANTTTNEAAISIAAKDSEGPEQIEIAAIAAALNKDVASAAITPISKPAPAPVHPSKKPEPRQPSGLELKLKQLIFGGNPLLKIGVLILFLGLAFLLRYASEYIVVPVQLRYAGVAAAGVALLIFGWRLRHKQDNYGLILQGTGIAVMYLTPLAAMRISDLLPPQMGFAFLVAVAGFATLLAILQDSFALAVVGTLGGFAAPILVSTGKDAHLALFTFLTLLNLGIAAIAWFKAWRLLNLIGFSGTFIIAVGWAHKFYQASLFGETEPFLLLYFSLYVLITFLFARRVLLQSASANSDAETFSDRMRHAAAQLNYVDGVLTLGVPFVAFAMQYEIAQPFAFGAAFSAMGFGLFYAVLALTLFRSGGQR